MAEIIFCNCGRCVYNWSGKCSNDKININKEGECESKNLADDMG